MFTGESSTSSLNEVIPAFVTPANAPTRSTFVVRGLWFIFAPTVAAALPAEALKAMSINARRMNAISLVWVRNVSWISFNDFLKDREERR